MRFLVTAAAVGATVLFPGHRELQAQTGQTAPFRPAMWESLQYRSVGPSRGGRVTAVAGHVDHPETFYMGATGGGVWKTTDYGANWFPISDGYFNTGSIGSIRVADSDPNIVYVGTGSDGIRSNVITGRGIYKSTDAGETWELMGLRETGQIGAVLIHPTNPNVVYAAALGDAFSRNTERGVYRTTDGGRTWENVLFISDSTGAVDLEFAPDNPQEIYASMWRGERKPWTIISGAHEGGVYKSSDGGDTWTQLTNGLPSGLRGKSDLAVSPADPDRVYVLIEAPEPDDGLYRSDDRGATWYQVTSYNPILNRPFYYTGVEADPHNADIVYVNNEGFYKSTDGGRNFQRRPTPHGDNHDIWINPENPDIMIQSNDGGANVTLDGGDTWSTQHNQPTAELYQVDIDDRYPYWLYAGQQDNTTIRVPSARPYSHPGGYTGYWEEVGGCETGPVVPKPGNADIVYANCKGRFGRFSAVTGQEKQYYVGFSNIYGHDTDDLEYRFQRVAPIHVSPHDPDVVYHASQYLHRTTDDGVTWETISPDLTARTPETQVASGEPITRDITGEEHFSVIYTVRESSIQPGLIWVGANDGPIHVTRDGGRNWTEVTPPDLGPYGRVQTVEPSPHDAAKAYAAVLRYQLGDYQPYIYRTNDYGSSWTRLTTGDNGIPDDYPTRVVREDPDREGLLYAGTEFGMFISFDDGVSWQPFQMNLPVTPVTDLKVFRQDVVISTMGRGFWVMDDITPLHELTQQVASARYHFFQPSETVRTRGGGFGGFGGQRDPAAPEYPRPGAHIDYYLSSVPSGDVTLEILDGSGNLVRGFSSAASGEVMVEPAEPGMREFRLERVGTPRLSKDQGFNRFVWDLSHAGPWDPNPQRSGRGGPMVEPGVYQARLSVGDWSATHSVTVKMDPRVLEDGVTPAHVAEQVALALQVRDALSEARMAAARLDQAQEDFSSENTTRAQRALEELAEIERLMVTDETEGVRYPQPMLIDQFEYLYGNLDRADQEPGRDAEVRFETLRGLLDGYIQRLERLIATDAAVQ